MKDRIEHILEEYQLSPSRFADELGIQRSGVSHIMSGRNKPSLELIQKILTRFPELNSDWLVQGTGPMKKEAMDPNQITLFDVMEIPVLEKAPEPPVLNNHTPHHSIKNEFREKVPPTAPQVEKHVTPLYEAPEVNVPEKPSYISQQPVYTPPVQNESNILQDHTTIKAASSPISSNGSSLKVKTIEKIMIFYSDKTFSEYRPE